MAPNPKWNRVVLACDRCRKFKKRCDGGRPICGTCARRGVNVACNYVKAPERARSTRRGSERGSVQEEITQDSDDETTEFDFGLDNNQSDVGETMSLVVDQIAGLATVASIPDERDHGTSSAIAFLRNVLPTDSLVQERRSAVLAPFSSIPLKEKQDRAALSALLMDQSLMVSLLDSYSTYSFSVLPVLDVTCVYDRYQRLILQPLNPHTKVSRDELQRTSVYLALALGSRSQARFDLAQALYDESQRSFPQDFLNVSTLEALEVLLLSAMYVHCTSNAIRRWNATGLVVRMALGLGLHIDRPSLIDEKYGDPNTRRRLWYSSVMMERFTSLLFGRPDTTAFSWTVPLPLNLGSAETLNRGYGRQNQLEPGAMDCFVICCGLLRLVSDTMTIHTAVDYLDLSALLVVGGKMKETALSEVAYLDQRMLQYRDELPEYFRVMPTTQAGRFRYGLLHSRFLLLRIILHRPMLTMQMVNAPVFVSHQSRDGFPFQLALVKQSAEYCILAACEMIDLLQALSECGFDFSAWDVLYYAFLAGLIITTAYQSSRMALTLEIEPEVYYRRCINILAAQKFHHQNAQRAVHLLHLARQKMLNAAHNVSTGQPGEGQAGHATVSQVSSSLLTDEDVYGLMARTNSSFDMTEEPSLDWLDGVVKDLDIFQV